MKQNRDFLTGARQAYEEANAAALRWLLARPLLGGAFLNSKQNSITLADYGAGDGLRGPAFTYGWIQGRGLEALVTHAGHFDTIDPQLAVEIDAVARGPYRALGDLWARDGHAYFCYDAQMRPIVADTLQPQSQPADIFTYSDIFVVKGLIAAAARYAPADLPRHLGAFNAIVSAIEDGRFQMNERQPLSSAAIAAEAEDFGPRMILLGAAGMLTRIGQPEPAAFADRFIKVVLEKHFDPASGLLRNVPGEDACNVGHGIEFVGFALDYLPPDADPALIAKLETILFASFVAGFHGPGVRLAVSVATGAPLSPYCPWWSLPETIRSTALAYERTGNPASLETWQQAHAAFFKTYWRGTPAIAYQTMTEEGPVDFVPATPDLDPGYHTGLSLLAAIDAVGRMTGSRPR
jgi:hypothetical protein